MTNRSKMILGLASLLGVTAGATAVSGFAWFVTTKTADVDVTNIGIYNNNPSLSVELANLKGVKRTNDAANDFDLKAANDSTTVDETFTADGTGTTYVLSSKPLEAPEVYIDGVLDSTHSYDGNLTVSFASPVEAGKKVRVLYCDKAALTDVSSVNGKDVYDPTWETAYEGRRATKIEDATAGEQYISFDLQFAAATTGSLKVFLDRPNISPKATSDSAQALRNEAAASVARVAFWTNTAGNVLTLSKNTGTGYTQGIDKDLVEDYPGDPAIATDPSKNKDASTEPGDYKVSEVCSACENLYAPIDTNYSILSAAPEATAANMHLVTITNTPITVHVSIWLEGTSAVNGDGNYSAPIGGEIDVKLNLVAFGA